MKEIIRSILETLALIVLCFCLLTAGLALAFHYPEPTWFVNLIKSNSGWSLFLSVTFAILAIIIYTICLEQKQVK